MSAILFAVAVLLAPAWHATQASQPAEYFAGEEVHPRVVEVVSDCCCQVPADDPAPAEHPVDQDTPSPESPCPDDGQCPCCKLIVVASAATLPTWGSLAIDQKPTPHVIARVDRPDSQTVAIDVQPPIA